MRVLRDTLVLTTLLVAVSAHATGFTTCHDLFARPARVQPAAAQDPFVRIALDTAIANLKSEHAWDRSRAFRLAEDVLNAMFAESSLRRKLLTAVLGSDHAMMRDLDFAMSTSSFAGEVLLMAAEMPGFDRAEPAVIHFLSNLRRELYQP